MTRQRRADLRYRFSRRLAAGASLALLLAVASAAVCDGPVAPRRLTLAEAMRIATRENRVLKAAKFASVAAQSEADEERGALLPRLDAGESFSNTNNPPEAFSNLLAQQDFAASNFAIDSLNHPSPLSNFQSQFRLSQPLFAGGRILAAFRAAGFAAEAERWRTVRTRQQIEFVVVQTYYRAVLAEERVGVIERALAAAQAHLVEAHDLLTHGMVVKADVLRTQVLTGTLEQQRIDAANQLLISWAELAHALGDERERLAPLEHPRQLEQPLAAPGESLDSLKKDALAKRPELEIAKARVRQAGQAITIARAGYLPSVNLETFYENDSERLARAGNSYAVLVMGRVNLFNGLATRAKVERATAELKRAEVLDKDLAQAVALEVETAYRTLDTARQSVEVARRDNAYAAEALRILEDRYRSGLATNVAVLDGQTARQQADMGLAQAKVAVLVGAATLDLATGRSPAAGAGD